MVAGCRWVASTAVAESRSPDGGRPIPHRDGAPSTFCMEREILRRVPRKSDSFSIANVVAYQSGPTVTLKYLFTAALVALLIWLLYRRLRPYLQVLLQVLRAFTGTLEGTSQSQGRARQDGSANKLVRCAACSTWIPMNRALHAHSSSFCSDVCLLQAPKVSGRKAAG